MKILEKITLYKNLILYICVGLFVFLFIWQCDRNQKLKSEIKEVEIVSNRNYNNLLASQDSVRVEKTKNGNLVSKISSYEFEVNSLSKDNKKILKKYQTALNLNKDLNDINTALSADIKIKDSIINAKGDIVFQSEDSINIKFNNNKQFDSYNFRKFSGTAALNKINGKFKVTNSKFNFEQGMNIKAAIAKVNGRNELRITTNYPNVKFTNIENINIVNDKLNPLLRKEKNWSIGVGIQYGLTLNQDQIIGNGWSIGIGIQWSPKWLRF